MTAIDPGDRKRVGCLWAAIFVLLCIVLAGAALYWWAFLMREHHRWTETIKLWDGLRLEIQQYSSQRVYHGNHVFGFGGGDPWQDVQFTIRGEKYRWEGPYIPIAIQRDETHVYIVVYDRETQDYRGSRFRLYRSVTPTSWEEIGPERFPRYLAIQNTWLHKYNGALNEYELVDKMDPAEPWFRRSLTAKLWNYLENADFSMDMEPPEDFLRQFKKKWVESALFPKGARNAERRG
jgi:hypothetical protein